MAATGEVGTLTSHNKEGRVNLTRWSPNVDNGERQIGATPWWKAATTMSKACCSLEARYGRAEERWRTG
jgi:hypothetical protein